MDANLAETIRMQLKIHTIDSPVPARVLAAENKTSIRHVMNAIEDLRDAGYHIGSSKKKPRGIFTARTPDELNDTLDHMEKEAKRILQRVARMRVWPINQTTIAPPIENPLQELRAIRERRRAQHLADLNRAICGVQSATLMEAER